MWLVPPTLYNVWSVCQEQSDDRPMALFKISLMLAFCFFCYFLDSSTFCSFDDIEFSGRSFESTCFVFCFGKSMQLCLRSAVNCDLLLMFPSEKPPTMRKVNGILNCSAKTDVFHSLMEKSLPVPDIRMRRFGFEYSLFLHLKFKNSLYLLSLLK